MRPKIAVLRGDGIGPEVVEAALSVLGACQAVEIHEALVGGAAIDRCGQPLPAETLELCRGCQAVLLGAVGGPRWSEGPRPEEGLLALRRGLGLWANLRPARGLGLPTPLRDELVRGADVLIVRELSSGVYFGEPRGLAEGSGFNTWRQTRQEVRRVAQLAFRAARQRRHRVTSVDKANVLEASRLWRAAVEEVAADYPDVALEHRYVDAMSFELLQAPQRFDVVLADNLFGDILSDEAAALVGSIGLMPSASLGDGPPLFEPVHGSAPDLAGRGLANPTGALLSVALLLEHALGRPDLGQRLEAAVTAALHDTRTPDIGGRATTTELAAQVQRHLARPPGPEPEEPRLAYGWGV